MISTWFKKRKVKTLLAGFLLLYYIQAHTMTSKNVSSFSYEKLDKLHFLNNWMTFKTGGYGGIILVMRNLKLLMYIKWISYICIQLVWKNLALILKITLKGKMHASCRCQAINHTVQSYIIHSKTSLLKMIWFTMLEPWTTFHLQTLIENDCVEALTFVLLDLESRIPVLSEVTAALAVMADEGTCSCNTILMSLNKGQSNINLGAY